MGHANTARLSIKEQEEERGWELYEVQWLQSLSHNAVSELVPVNSSGSSQKDAKTGSMTQELILSILGANATRRDAKWYLTRYAEQTSKLAEISGMTYASLFHIKASTSTLADVAQGIAGEIASLHKLGMSVVILLLLEDAKDANTYRLCLRKLADAIESHGCRTLSLHGQCLVKWMVS